MQLRDHINALPNELANLIITHLIDLHDDDPVYQWTHLRCITRLHRAQVEQHFHDFWLPRLSLVHAHKNGGTLYEMVPNQPNHDSEKDKVEFKFHDHQSMRHAHGADKSTQLCMLELRNTKRLLRARHWQNCTGVCKIVGKVPMIVRMGEGMMNNGFAGGGIIMDMPLPNVAGAPGCNIQFNWKSFFTNWFAEELLMQRMRDELLRIAFPPEPTTCIGPAYRLSVRRFLRVWYQLQHREMIYAFRASKATRPCKIKFDITPFLSAPAAQTTLEKWAQESSLLAYVREEESLIFAVPGWEMWSDKELIDIRLKDVRQQLDHHFGDLRSELIVGSGLRIRRLKCRQLLLQKAQKGEEDAKKALKICWKYVGTGEEDMGEEEG